MFANIKRENANAGNSFTNINGVGLANTYGAGIGGGGANGAAAGDLRFAFLDLAAFGFHNRND